MLRALYKKRDIDLHEVLVSMEWYNAISSSYDELYSAEQYSKYEVIAYNINRDVNLILDVGCGSGLILEYLTLKGYNIKYYVGLDISSKMIELALRRSKNLNVMADFIIADLTYPPIRSDDMFDVITLITVLKSDYNVRGITEKYLQFLKDNGLLIYTILTKKVIDDVMRYEYLSITTKNSKKFDYNNSVMELK